MDIHMAIEEYLACKANRLTHTAYRWYRWGLGAFERWCLAQGIAALSQVSAPLVQGFVAANPHAKGNTKHHRAQLVKSFLNWCTHDPAMGVKALVVKRIEMPKVDQEATEMFSQEEIMRLLKACEKTRSCLRNRAIVLLLLDTGIRLAELAYDGSRPEERTGLLLENVIFGEQESYIVVMGKGRKTRTVKIGQQTCQVLQEYLEYERPASTVPSFFLVRGNCPLSVRRADKILKELGKLAGVKNVHTHRFRHTFAIQQLLARTNALVLMQMLGHTSLESVLTYTRALSQMQARQASASVVDEMWQRPRSIREAFIRGGVKQRASLKAERARKQELGIAVPAVHSINNDDLRDVYAQWTTFFRAWWERLGEGAWISTSEARDHLSDVLPASVQPKEGEHPKAFLYRLRTALHQRSGVSYGDEPVSVRCWPAVKRGMNLWQVYQVSVPE